jgi:hypothetical protein
VSDLVHQPGLEAVDAPLRAEQSGAGGQVAKSEAVEGDHDVGSGDAQPAAARRCERAIERARVDVGQAAEVVPGELGSALLGGRSA